MYGWGHNFSLSAIKEKSSLRTTKFLKFFCSPSGQMCVGLGAYPAALPHGAWRLLLFIPFHFAEALVGFRK